MEIKKRLKPKQRKDLRAKVKQEKKTARVEKSTRLLESPEYQHSPRMNKVVPVSGKNPRLSNNPDSIMSCLMEWCKSVADIDGCWSWNQPRQWQKDEWDCKIYPKLCELGNLTWAEIYKQRTGCKKRHKLHHDMDVCNIIPEACNRWREIGLEDYDTAFRFRFAGKQRLWGYKILAKFHIIWWDPKHKIYPTEV